MRIVSRAGPRHGLVGVSIHASSVRACSLTPYRLPAAGSPHPAAFNHQTNPCS